MDRIQYQKTHIQIGIGAVVFFMLFITLLNATIIKPKKKKLLRVNENINILNERMRGYNNFENTMKTFESKKQEVKSLVEEFQSNLITRDRIDQAFLEKINEITKTAGVKIDKLTPIGSSIKVQSGYEKQVWKISFFTDYNSLLKFLSLLQQNATFFGVEELNIISGRNKSLHRANMNIYLIIPSAGRSETSEYELKSSTVIFTIPFDSVKLMNKINQTRRMPIMTYKLEKDPMYFRDTIFPHVAQEQPQVTRKVKKAPRLHLGGIMWDEANPEAIINGKVVGVGEKIDSVKIISISETTVRYKWDNKIYKLKLE